jgi:carboxypeptidase Q
MIKRFTTTIFALSFCFSAFAQETIDMAAVQKIKTEGLENSKVMDITLQV